MNLEIRRILVPLDFSTHSDHALTYALGLAKVFGATLELLHACHLPALAVPIEGNVAASGSAELLEAERKAAEKALAERARRAEAESVPVEIRATQGTAAEAICERARNTGADLIVIGTRGRTGLAHVLFGSVAERTVMLAPCPVLTVRAPDESAANG